MNTDSLQCAPDGEHDLGSSRQMQAQRAGGEEVRQDKTCAGSPCCYRDEDRPATSHLNLKWTISDTDAIKRMGQNGRTAYSIALWFTRNGKPTGPDEIMRLCDEMGVRLRKAKEPKAGAPA